MTKKWWYCVDADAFELPCTPVFDTAQELADYLRRSATSIRRGQHRGSTISYIDCAGRKQKARIVAVERVGDEDEIY